MDTSLSPYRAYYYAAAYPQDATQVFRRIRDIVLHEEVNLSVYNVPPVTLPPGWHIVVIGGSPLEAIHIRILSELSGGILTTIPYELLMLLFARKLEQNAQGTRREGHTSIRLKRKKKSTKQAKRRRNKNR